MVDQLFHESKPAGLYTANNMGVQGLVLRLLCLFMRVCGTCALPVPILVMLPRHEWPQCLRCSTLHV